MKTLELKDLNTVTIESEIISLRELQESNRDDLVRIVKNYSVYSTALLYLVFLEDNKIFEEKVKSYDITLQNLIPRFYAIKDKYPYSGSKTPEGQKQFKKILEYVKNNFPDTVLYSPYGPIKQSPSEKEPFVKSVEEFIHNGIVARKEEPKRKMFRLGIFIEETIIGCVTFDFFITSIDDYSATGDIGIFIEPKYREIKDKDNNEIGKLWREVFYAVSVFIKNIFPHDPANMYISATTHPLNWATERMLEKFNFVGIKNSEYGKRKYYVIPYNYFLATFLNKSWERDRYQVQSDKVMATINGQSIDISVKQGE